MYNTLNKMLGREVNVSTLDHYSRHLGWLYMGHNKNKTLLFFTDNLMNGKEIRVVVEFVSKDRVKIKKIIKKY